MPSGYDLAVIGAGFWGRAIAHFARKRGWSVVLFDDGDPQAGSRASSGIVHPDIYGSSLFKHLWPSDWTKEDLSESLNWLVKMGGVKTTESFVNLFAEKPPRRGVESIYLPSNEAFLPTAIQYQVVGVGLDNIPARRMVLAAGWKTDSLLLTMGLPKLGVDGLYGWGWEIMGTPRVTLPVEVMVRPYCKVTIRTWKDHYRIGDTAPKNERNKAADANRDQEFRAALDWAFADWTKIKVCAGYRPVADRFIVEKLAPNLVVATGGHRMGIGIAGLVGKMAISMFD